jgi:lipopolysaccharide heptosyltransferase II
LKTGVKGLENARKILLRATNWLGDAVISLPALETLRERFPAAEIVLVTKPWVSELYMHYRAPLRQIIYDPAGRHRGPQGFKALVRDLRREGFGAAILFQNAFQAAWMAWRAEIPVRIGYARDGRRRLLTEAVPVPPPGAYGHQAYYYLQLLFRAGLIDRPEPVRPLQQTRLVLRDAEKSWAGRRLELLGLSGPRFLVGMAPGASFGPAKRWLPERFAALADRLIGELHADVLIFGSAAEQPLAEAVAQAMRHTPLVVAGKTTLTQFMALLAECRVLVSNDSGPMHLAAALGLPVAAVFGSTDERATGPLGERTRVLKRPVPCSPCGLRECPIDFRCMRQVSVEEVSQAVVELLKEQRVANASPV